MRVYLASVEIGMMVYASSKEEAAEIAAAKLTQELDEMLRDADSFHVREACTDKHRILAEKWSEADHPYTYDDIPTSTIGTLFDAEQGRPK